MRELRGRAQSLICESQSDWWSGKRGGRDRPQSSMSLSDVAEERG